MVIGGASALSGSEMAENGAFVAKPARGWLHPDSVLASDGITYAVRVRNPVTFLPYLEHFDHNRKFPVTQIYLLKLCTF